MTKKIFIITGETSGDLLAYKVIKNIITSNIEIKGIVGSNLKKLNIDGPFESKDITFFGITDVVKNIFYIKKKLIELFNILKITIQILFFQLIHQILYFR